MRYRKLGKWGVKLSVLGLGSYLTIGFKCSEKVSGGLIRTAYDAGVNFFDTANVYAGGEAESVLGRHLGEFPRSSIFLLTKVWGPMGEGPNDSGLSAKHVKEQCEASLRRLNMDYIDAYMCHRPDPETPLEETVLAMEDLARQGKIIYWGVSEWPAGLILEAQKEAGRTGARPISISQPRYNLLYRNPEKDLFPFTRAEGIGNVVFSPLAHGILTGKYTPGAAPPEGTRAHSDDTSKVMKEMYWSRENKVNAKKFAGLAEQAGLKPSQLAIAWCLLNGDVSSVILGATSTSQLKENLYAAELDIPAGLSGEIESLFRGPGAGG